MCEVTKKKSKTAEVETVVEIGAEESVEETMEEAGGEEERIAALEQELERAQAQAAEYLDGWQRAQAEFANYKRRQEAERAQTTALASVALLRRILPVVDDFERAVAAVPLELRPHPWVEGILLIKQKLDNVLEAEGLQPIPTEGETFDPRYHEAVTYEEAAGYSEGQIIGVVQRGYMLGERVVRPALVRVAKAE